MAEFNFADLFEAMADEVPARTVVVVGDARRSYAELEDRANRLAHHLLDLGVEAGDHVGIYAYNSPEWVEALFALYKIRAVPVNINYRYVEDELRYLFDNADLVAVVFQREFAPRVAAVRTGLATLRHLLVVEDGSGADLSDLEAVAYEDALDGASPARDFGARSGDDIHMIYTGGSTGMPKGVMWRQEDIFFALCGGIDAYTNQRMQRPEQLVERVREGAEPVTLLTAAPLMHGAGEVATIRAAITGDTVVLLPKFDAETAWRTVARERANTLMITGDAMARPLTDALVSLKDDLDLTSLFAVSSSAAIFSQSIKDELMEMMPNVVIVDSIGATETGMNGIKVAQKGEESHGGPATVQASLDSIVVDDAMRPVAAGSGVVGRLARTGNIPLGYYKDAARSAQTFVEFDGRRYALAGDFAKVEADGQITLLGRGSVMINTGGEKVYPEEVEGVLKAHPDVFDVLVVGVPDERWGERVTAVVQPRAGKQPTVDELAAHCRTHIAGYKVPRQVFLVDQVVRAPSGKPDYPWAKAYARKPVSGDESRPMRRGVATFMVLVLVVALGATALLAFDIGGSGGGGATATSRSTTTSTVKFSGTGGEPFCRADQQFNDSIAQQAPKSLDAAALKADYERRLAAVRGLEALAPAEIKGDVTIIRGAYEALAVPLPAVGYDLSKLSAADKAKIQTPEVNLAGARLDQYDTQICKVTQGTAPSTAP